MKTVKKAKGILALLLAFAMVVSGMYFVKPEGSEAKAETATGATVDDGMLNVKVQAGKNADESIKALRFVTSVNSLDYKEVGFVINWEENREPKSITWPVRDNTVFERIESSVEDSYMSYKFSPKVVDTSAEYFATGKLNVTGKESTLYTVKAYVVTFEDETVYGASRCVSYDDAATTAYINMSFVSSSVPTENSIAATYGTSSTETTATVIGKDVNENGGYNIHVTVPVNPNSLPSATKFTFGSYGNTVYRNLYTTHVKVEGDTSQINADTSWYDVDKTATEFVIATSADLYGLAAISNANEKFVSDTIYLVSDIAINPTTDGETAKAWADAAGTKPSDVYAWTPIAGNGYYSYFGGTFDGQMHKISGLYLEKAGEVGMFGVCQSGSSVKNFYLKESYVKSTGNKAGSVAGCFNGTMENVYSNAVVSSAYQYVGGFAGTLEDDKATIMNCWFAGELRLQNDYGKYGGGIVGSVYAWNQNQREYYLIDNLFTGEIKSTCTRTPIATGGIIGGGSNTYAAKKIHVTNCLSAGSISASSTNGVGSILGVMELGTADLINTYGTTNSYSVDTNITNGTINGITTGASLGLTNADLYGVAGYQKTLLDFEDTWVAREGNVPALKAFDDVITEEIVDLSGVEQDNWYNDKFTIFGIGTASALQSIATYVNAETPVTFQYKTVCLYEDVEVNEVKEGTLAAWKAGSSIPTTSWTPIGCANKPFLGTFDGQMHTISGIYLKTTTLDTTITQGGYGLFGQLGWCGTIKNCYLEDSYFNVDVFDSYVHLGSIVGNSIGKIENVYSNAILTTQGGRTGGIVGLSGATNLSNCWFDGDIHIKTGNGKNCGGIVGYIADGSAQTITNVLFSGNITYEYNYLTTENIGVGGIVGGTWEYYSSSSTTITNAISAGTINKANTEMTQGVGAVVGMATRPISMVNVYGTTDCWEPATNELSGMITGTVATPTEAELYGDLAKTNASALDYTSTWVTRTDDVPALAIFTKVLGQ